MFHNTYLKYLQDFVWQQQFLKLSSLTHLPLDKMAAILADDIFKCIFLNANDRIPI